MSRFYVNIVVAAVLRTGLSARPDFLVLFLWIPPRSCNIQLFTPSWQSWLLVLPLICQVHVPALVSHVDEPLDDMCSEATSIHETTTSFKEAHGARSYLMHILTPSISCCFPYCCCCCCCVTQQQYDMPTAKDVCCKMSKVSKKIPFQANIGI